MPGPAGLFLLLAIASAAALWWHHQRAQEKARAVIRRACRETGVQLLDDSVGLVGLRPRWNRGRPLMVWHFGFEFSRTGGDRSRGRITLRGPTVDEILFDLDPG